jgi:CheY-like chemotaxis protein
VKQNNGSIAVESEPGKGTTFNIYLPRVQGIPDVLPMRHESGYLPTGNETVLIVEDEPSVRLVAAQILQNQGYEVLIASDGEEALRMARELTNQQIHLLLTDVVMPLMSGSQLAARFREIHPEAGILYTSGYNNDASVHPVVIDKGSLFLQKPFTPGVLARKVREVLDR